MTYEEIEEKLEKYYEGDMNLFAKADKDEIKGLGTFKEVAQKGGSDQGSEWWSVKYFKDLDLYFKIEGYYSSYEGCTFDDWGSIVKPTQKTITVYE